VKTNLSISARQRRGYTLVEVLITMTILVLTLAMCLSLFVTSLKIMYKDTQRLMTNGVLRNLTAQVAKETVDSSEFYLFPTYEKLDGSVDLTADVSAADATNTTDYYGDCLVLVTRVADTGSSTNIRQWRVYYRVVTAPNQDGAIRYYESADWGASTGSTTALATLLNAVNLKLTPAYPGSRILATTARGRLRPSSSNYYPIFNSNAATFLTNVNQSVSINVEVINGTSSNNLISSSSFNYTISPRR
jgi:prepilin-type N-terminal cleavage/methylation domain-containing protein